MHKLSRVSLQRNVMAALLPANATAHDRARYASWTDKTRGKDASTSPCCAEISEQTQLVALSGGQANVLQGRPCAHVPVSSLFRTLSLSATCVQCEDVSICAVPTQLPGVAIVRGALSRDDARAIRAWLADDPAFDDPGDIARTDGLPRRQVTLLRQVCVCEECFTAGGSFAAYRIAASPRHARLISDIVMPLATKLVVFAKAKAQNQNLSLWSAFVRRYDATSSRRAMPCHADMSELTVSVSLSPQGSYQGGALEFEGAPALTTGNLDAGDAVVHHGGAIHGISPVTQGERWSLVCFFGDDSRGMPMHVAEKILLRM